MQETGTKENVVSVSDIARKFHNPVCAREYVLGEKVKFPQVKLAMGEMLASFLKLINN